VTAAEQLAQKDPSTTYADADKRLEGDHRTGRQDRTPRGRHDSTPLAPTTLSRPFGTEEPQRDAVPLPKHRVTSSRTRSRVRRESE